MQEVTYTLLF